MTDCIYFLHKSQVPKLQQTKKAEPKRIKIT